MSFRRILVVACCLSVPARSQCIPNKQIAQIMNTWVQDWNEKRIDDLMKLYYSHAVLLPADGSRAREQGEIREYFEKQIGTKMELSSPGPGFVCIDNKVVPTVAIENGTYKESRTGKTIEGHYLVVLIYLENSPGGPRWIIAQQALTAKPQSQSVLLPEREAYKITRRCSRGGPSKVDGTWRPTKVDLDRLESRLPRISKLSSIGAMPVVNGLHIEHPNQFYRQYIAIVIGGHKFIYINAFCVLADEPVPTDWREMLVGACDGGECYWGVLYDPRTGTFSDLQINGPG